MLIRAVIFDLGGVLVRTEDLSPRRKLAERLGMTYEEISRLIFEDRSAIQATLGRVTTKEHWETVRAALDMDPEDFPSVPLEFWGGDRLDTDLVEYIRSLRPRYKTGLLSNAWDNLRNVLIEDWKIADAFDEMIISAEVGMAKPDRRIYRLAADRLGVEPQEAVFIDDVLENIKAARAAGLRGIHFQSRAQTLAELEGML